MSLESKNEDEIDEILEPVFKLGYNHSDEDYETLKRQIQELIAEARTRERIRAYSLGHMTGKKYHVLKKGEIITKNICPICKDKTTELNLQTKKGKV